MFLHWEIMSQIHWGELNCYKSQIFLKKNIYLENNFYDHLFKITSYFKLLNKISFKAFLKKQFVEKMIGEKIKQYKYYF